MKMTQEDYNKLQDELKKLPLIRLPKNNGERWQCYHAANESAIKQGGDFKFRSFYDYLNDDNIEAALNKIFKEWNKSIIRYKLVSQ